MWDVIVVGSGPAGAIAAYELARGGCKTLLIEKERLPRYKTCGGGLVERSCSALPFPITDVVERKIRTIQLTNNFQDECLIRREKPVVFMTMRSALDYHLTQKAIERGAELREGVTLTAIHEDRSGVQCNTDSGTFRAAFVVGADGVNSMVARSLGWKRPICGVALEVETSLKTNAINDRLDFDFNVLPEGYGWVFPKANHLSCGVFTLKRNFPEIRTFYDNYIRRKSFARDIAETKLTGHLIPVKPVSDGWNSNRCVLTGDAAGLADPLTGEGISFAIRSGLLAAGAILRSPASLKSYSAQIDATLAKEMRISRVLAKMLYKTPSFFYGMLARKDFFAGSILDLFAGKTTYGELLKKLALQPHKLL